MSNSNLDSKGPISSDIQDLFNTSSGGKNMYLYNKYGINTEIFSDITLFMADRTNHKYDDILGMISQYNRSSGHDSGQDSDSDSDSDSDNSSDTTSNSNTGVYLDKGKSKERETSNDILDDDILESSRKRALSENIEEISSKKTNRIDDNNISILRSPTLEDAMIVHANYSSDAQKASGSYMPKAVNPLVTLNTSTLSGAIDTNLVTNPIANTQTTDDLPVQLDDLTSKLDDLSTSSGEAGPAPLEEVGGRFINIEGSEVWTRIA